MLQPYQLHLEDERCPSQSKPRFFLSNSAQQLDSELSSCREHDDHTDTTIVLEQRTADDIKGSPRLIGYLFSMIASGVMLISVNARKGSIPSTGGKTTTNDDYDPFVYFLGDAVYKWKLWGALYANCLNCHSPL